MSHADVSQVFFLVAGIYFCCRLAEDERPKWLWGASICAGFAYACKYSGMFIPPIIWVLSIAQTIGKEAKQIEVDAAQVARLSRFLTAAAGIVGLVASVVVIPRIGASFTDANSQAFYSGISRTQFFSTAQLAATLMGSSLVLLAIINTLWKAIGRNPKLAWVVKQGILSLAIFAGAFFVTSPNAVFSVRRNFLRGFLSQVINASFGAGFSDKSSGFVWGRLLWSPELLNSLILGLAAASFVLTVYRVSKDGWRGLFKPKAIMWGWVIFYLALLFFKGRFRTHRALLPVIPFLITFAAQAVSQGVKYATTRLPKNLGIVATVAILFVVLGLELPRSLDTITAFRQSAASREQTSVAVSAGHWLAEQYPASIRILHDNYSYVPPTFTDAHLTDWGGAMELLRTLEPDVVIVTAKEARQFSDIHWAKDYAKGEDEFMARHEYYAALRDEKAGYVLVRDFGDVLVYEGQHQ